MIYLRGNAILVPQNDMVRNGVIASQNEYTLSFSLKKNSFIKTITTIDGIYSTSKHLIYKIYIIITTVNYHYLNYHYYKVLSLICWQVVMSFNVEICFLFFNYKDKLIDLFKSDIYIIPMSAMFEVIYFSWQ